VLAALQGVITTYWLLLADRFLLGVTEAVVLPAMLVFLAHWFTRAESGRANTLLILGNLLIRNTVYSLDGDHVPVDDVHDPVPADPQPVIPAPVESFRRVRVGGQGGDGHADGTHAVLVSHVAAC
jgi:hypothetical protein